MTEPDIHKCLISTGIYPMTLVLKELEQENKFKECTTILNAMLSYIEKYRIVDLIVPTRWSEEFQKEYYSYFKNVDYTGQLLIKSNIDYYVKDIKTRLKL